jgi:hypothetical protein
MVVSAWQKLIGNAKEIRKYNKRYAIPLLLILIIIGHSLKLKIVIQSLIVKNLPISLRFVKKVYV